MPKNNPNIEKKVVTIKINKIAGKGLEGQALLVGHIKIKLTSE